MSEIPVKPIGFQVLIQLDQVSETVDASTSPKLAELGFKQATDTEQKRRQAGQMWATLLAKGETAFTNSSDWGESDRELMKDGSKVFIKRYSGDKFTTVGRVEADGAAYVVCADHCIKGLVNTENDLKLVEDS